MAAVTPTFTAVHLSPLNLTADMIGWEQCAKDFQWDGSLRDIYITPATINDWQAVFTVLRDYPGAEYSVDGTLQPPPANVDQAFAVRGTASPMLQIRVSRTLVVFHFFWEEEIECDIDPREVTSESDLVALLGFVRELGNITGKAVIITPENCREQPIISYDPDKHVFRYHDDRV